MSAFVAILTNDPSHEFHERSTEEITATSRTMHTVTTQPQKISAPSRSSFRPELQGLRALAVGLVLLFHLWPNHVSGGFVGVDVFFVISGFLITGHLYKELSITGTIKVTKFWARRIMRLLPLAFLVLVVSFLCLLLFLPETIWGMNTRQILASLFYVENWALAADSVDYMAADNEPSFVQHYWSLSIEEQFYFVLPLILLGIFAFSKMIRNKENVQVNTRTAMCTALILVGLVSFYVSVTYTNYQAAQAYFITPTRLWEFTVGGLVALIARSPILKPWIQNVFSWAGIVMILIAAFVYSGGTPFPGYTALLPVLGAALFIRYGTAKYLSPYWFASRSFAIRLGDWSYAIYLWHWPLIVIATYVLDQYRWPHKFAIIAITVILACASQKLIEDPLRQAKYFKLPRRAFFAMGTSLVLIAATTLSVPRLYASEYTDDVAMSDCTGAQALLQNCSDKGLEGEPLSPPAQVEEEKSEHPYPECFIPLGKTDFDRSDCSLGADPEEADLTIAVFGSSHARMWLPMFDEMGKAQNWNIQGYTKSGCSPVPLSKTDPDSSGSDRENGQACDSFVVQTAEELTDDENVDIIVTASLGSGENYFFQDGSSASEKDKIDAIDSMWQDWSDAGKKVIVMGEVPRFKDIEAPTCVDTRPATISSDCSTSYEAGISNRSTFQRTTAEEGKADIDLYDPADGICKGAKCYSMVGHLITRYDKHHLSEEFAKSYAPDFTRFMYEDVLG